MNKLIIFLVSFLINCNYLSAAEVSIYDAKLGAFRNDEDKPFHLKENSGKKVVISMVYTSCQSACPLSKYTE